MKTPLLKRALLGGVSGLVATVPMTILMAALHSRLPAHQQHPLPPEHIVSGLRTKLGLEETESTHEAQVAVAHFGYGAGVGSLYFTLAPWMPSLPGRGPLYGIAVWAVSYFGLLPGVGLLPSAAKDSPQRNGLMIAAHIVWGTTLQLCERVLLRSNEESAAVSERR